MIILLTQLYFICKLTLKMKMNATMLVVLYNIISQVVGFEIT